MTPSLASVALAHLARQAGIAVPVGSTITLADALALVDATDREQVYWAGRATLVRRPELISVYDTAFARFWDGRAALAGATNAAEVMRAFALAFDDGTAPPADDTDDADVDDAPQDDVEVLTVRWSDREVLRQRDFASYTQSEHDQAARLLRDLELVGSRRRSRRLRPTARPRQARPDVRRTVRDALRSGGEPLRRRYRAPGTRPRRIVLLLDVSGSMEPYARAFVRFLQTAVSAQSGVEAFALGTRLTRITKELASRDPDAAIAAAARRVADWSGGTRLGPALRAFNDTWGIPGMARGAIVVILSDGWDRGGAELLGEQMARLARVAHRIVWVNPLKASEGYAPLAQGMAAALPFVDDFVEGHSLAALEDLTRTVARS
ncbi:MAG TPA: VWA domain-containing protein [Acidimicrobiia bacterium]